MILFEVLALAKQAGFCVKHFPFLEQKREIMKPFKHVLILNGANPNKNIHGNSALNITEGKGFDKFVDYSIP